MLESTRDTLAKMLGGLQTDAPDIRQALQAVYNVITTGNISNSTGVAIGHHIRQVVNHFNLPPEAAAVLLDLRTLLGTSLGLDTAQYQWGNLVADKLRDFVGRAYVFDAIDAFLTSNPGGYFMIEGDPGMGKSALLAEYVRRTGCLAYFNVRTLGISGPTQFLQNLCGQIIADAELPYANLPADATRDGAFLLKLLREAADKLAAGDRLVIAVDALDEVDLTGHPAGANILFLPNTLPDNVYFILTRRRVDVPFVALAPQHMLDLMAYPEENRSDVEAYLHKAAERPALRAWIVVQGLTTDDFVALLVERSEKNFMYLYYVLPEIERGAYANLNANILPKGLEGYYEDHWRRMGMTAKPLPRVKLRIIYILCVLDQPASRQLITEFANNEKMAVDQLMVQEVLDEWDQFLHKQRTPDGIRFSTYHASFQDFLSRKDIVQAADVTIEGIHSLIADHLWKELVGE